MQYQENSQRVQVIVQSSLVYTVGGQNSTKYVHSYPIGSWTPLGNMIAIAVVAAPLASASTPTPTPAATLAPF